jgi:hypothetical protein
MGQGDRPRLINGKGTALVCVILTGYVAALTFRSAFSQSPHHSPWIFSTDFLPVWAFWTVNIAFYVYFLWLCLAFWSALRGKERILVVGWMPGLILSPIQGRVSAPLAAAIQYLKAFSIAVSFLAAGLILLEVVARDQGSSENPIIR